MKCYYMLNYVAAMNDIKKNVKTVAPCGLRQAVSSRNEKKMIRFFPVTVGMHQNNPARLA